MTYEQTQDMQEANTPHLLLTIAGGSVLLLLFLQRLLMLPLSAALQSGLLSHDGVVVQLAPYLVYLVSMVLTMLVARYLFGFADSFVFPVVAVRGDYLVPAVWAGLGVAMLGNLLAMFASLILASVGVYSYPNSPDFATSPTVTLITLFCMTVLPALCEELLFRGLLLQPLRTLGDAPAVVISALLFALVHPTLPQAISAFVVGLCLGTFAVRTGSLVLPMLLHFVYNSFACAQSLLLTHNPVAGAIASWLSLPLLILCGLVATAVLRHRFGVVWQLPHVGNSSAIIRAVITCVPLVAAVLLCLVTIVSNLFYLPTGVPLP